MLLPQEASQSPRGAVPLTISGFRLSKVPMPAVGDAPAFRGVGIGVGEMVEIGGKGRLPVHRDAVLCCGVAGRGEDRHPQREHESRLCAPTAGRPALPANASDQSSFILLRSG